MEKLLKGIVKFRRNKIRNYRKKFAKLADVLQSPDVLFIACCDSRVVPNTFASTDPGDLFVHRNIGNLVPRSSESNLPGISCTGATIEFAVGFLKVKHIVVCGHSECGAMQAILNEKKGLESYHDLKDWLKYGEESKKRFEDGTDIEICEHHKKGVLDPHNALSQVNVLQQVDNLLTYDIISEKIRNNTLQLHSWWFDLATADVSYFNVDKFNIIDAKTASSIVTK